MKATILSIFLLFGAGLAHAETQTKVSCRGNPQEALSEIQRFLQPGSKMPEGSILTPTFDLRKMKESLPADALVNNEAMAVALGQIFLARVYGDKIIEHEKPFKAHLVGDEVWIVERKITDEMIENCIIPTTSHYVAIQKSDGAILGVRLDK